MGSPSRWDRHPLTHTTNYNNEHSHCPRHRRPSQQGGATIRALLQQGGFTIRTLSRNPDSLSATRLFEQGVQVLKCGITDQSSLVAAFQGVDTVSFMTDKKGPQGTAGEVLQGKTVLRAVHEVGVRRIVFSSVQSAGHTASIWGVPHFESKTEVEKFIKESRLQWTILRPSAFMDVIPLSGAGRYMSLGLIGAMLGQKKPQFIATEDIGIVAAKAIAVPERFSGRTIDLAGDELSAEDPKTRLSRPLFRMWGRLLYLIS